MPVKCFNCQEEGHISSRCPKPKRARASHQIKNCPKKEQGGEPFRSRTTNVVEMSAETGLEVKYSEPYFANVEFDIQTDSCIVKCNINALVDSGSPISLIKKKYVSNQYTPCEPEQKYAGLNKS